MKFRQLPRTDLMLSEVGFGVWTVATNWWGKLEDAERAALLENAVELGINFFDTADTYGDGFGEEILARVLGHKRNDIVIATKFGYDIYDPTPRDGHRSVRRSSTVSSSSTPASRACGAWTPTTSTCTRSTIRGWTHWSGTSFSRRWSSSSSRARSGTTV